MRRIATAALLVTIAGSVASAQEIVGRDQPTFSVSERVSRGGWVRIASPNGDVSVTQGTGDRVEVRAEKIVRGGSVRDVGFVVYKEAEGLTVCALYDGSDCDRDGSMHNESRRGWRSNSHQQTRVNFTVRIPAGMRVKAGTGNGDVSIAGAGEEAIAGTGNGKVRVSGAGGEVNASSGNGEVTVEDAKGPVEASSGNGDIRVSTSMGPVSASSGNGDIVVAMEKLTSREKMQFTTGNGRIRLTVPSDFGAELESDTGNGEVLTDFPITIRGKLSKSHLRGTLGGGGPRLTLSSGNGDLEIRKGGS